MSLVVSPTADQGVAIAGLHRGRGAAARDGAEHTALVGNGVGDKVAPAARQVLLYEEADLRPVATPAWMAVPRLVGELRSAGTAPARERIVRARLQRMGFEWMVYFTRSQPPGGVPSHACLSTYANQAWLQSYCRNDYGESHPLPVPLPRSTLPLVWDLQDLRDSVADHPAPQRARRFIQDIADSGIGSGIFLRTVCSAAQPGEHAVLSLLSSAPDRRWIGEALLGDALTFGLSLHDFLSRHVTRPASPDLPAPVAPGLAAAALPAMQQEVLRLVVHGFTDKQIADRLKVSTHTVDYHLRQLRQRFAARNRVQLINAADHLLASL